MRINKKAAAVAVAAVTVAGVGTAYAYWTTSGTGNGSGVAASSADGPLSIHTDSAVANVLAGLAPGKSATFHLFGTNTSATDLRVGVISTAVTTTKTGCAAADVTVDTLDAISKNIPGINSVGGGATANVDLGTVTATYANDAANSQDACKGATFALAFTTASTPTTVTP